MTRLAVHGVVTRSGANGPGTRAVVWVQGCQLRCPGCFNPQTHGAAGGTWHEPRALAVQLARPDLDGLTVTGGEPLDQWDATLALLSAWRGTHTGSTLLLTGYTLEQVAARHGETGLAALKELLDVAIAGPYRADAHLGTGLRGSSNKRVHLLSDRHTLADIDRTPVAEVIIDARGRVVSTGVNPLVIS